MAEFCNKCVEKYVGDEFKPDIDVYALHEALQPGYMISNIICEGCGLNAVQKTEDGELRVLIYDDWCDY